MRLMENLSDMYKNNLTLKEERVNMETDLQKNLVKQ